MPKWRKSTWVMVVWTVLMALWIASGWSSAASMPVSNEYEEAGRAIGTGIGVTLLFLLWFIGFVALFLVWFMTRPKDNVLIYGPQGQQVTVPEKEARKRVERQGWTYQKSEPGSLPDVSANT